MSFKCPLCNKNFVKLISLSVHFRKTHKSTSKNLYILLFCKNVQPLCACGCGEETKFLSISEGFRDFKRGHASRIPEKNNFVSEKAQKRSQETRRKMWNNGELKIWNKGLTKETNVTVAKYGKSGSKTINSNKEELKKRSERMKQARLNKLA